MSIYLIPNSDTENRTKGIISKASIIWINKDIKDSSKHLIELSDSRSIRIDDINLTKSLPPTEIDDKRTLQNVSSSFVTALFGKKHTFQPTLFSMSLDKLPVIVGEWRKNNDRKWQILDVMNMVRERERKRG